MTAQPAPRPLAGAHHQLLTIHRAAFEQADPSLPGHAWRVSQLAVALGRARGLAAAALEHLSVGGILHDIGKQDIPSALLRAPRRLLAEEQAIVRRHARAGAGRLAALGYAEPIVTIAAHHHERWDGAGYPDGLAGEGIPLLARIVAVADVWDALMSKRSYKRALPRETCEGILRELAGTGLDSELVDLFLLG